MIGDVQKYPNPIFKKCILVYLVIVYTSNYFYGIKFYSLKAEIYCLKPTEGSNSIL